MNMTRRAYAASLGLAKPDARGRMSAEAHAAIAKAELEGKTFSDASAPAKRAAVKAAPKAGQFDAKAVRGWAVSVGLSVNARGRLSAEILEAYKKAHPDVKPSEPGTQVKVTGKDIRPHAPRTRSARTEYVAYYKGKRLILNEREACRCGSSLSHCKCGSPFALGMEIEVHSR